MMPYGKDYNRDAIYQSLKKKYPGTKHWKAINFFLPSGKGRERKNEVKLVINKS